MTDPLPQDTPSQDDTTPEHADTPPENEVLRAARLAKEQAEKAEATTPDPGKGKRADGAKVGWKTGVGIGVGSAALLAALLYANRKK